MTTHNNGGTLPIVVMILNLFFTLLSLLNFVSVNFHITNINNNKKIKGSRMAETLITLYEECKIEMKNRYTKYSNTYKTQNKLTKPQSSFCSTFTPIPPL